MLSRCLLVVVVLGLICVARAQEGLPQVEDVERQPLVAQVKRLVEALDYLGVPLREVDRAALDAAGKEMDSAAVTAAVQKVLDPYCLAGVELKSDQEVTAVAGPAEKKLVEQGWTQFLVKVHNV